MYLTRLELLPEISRSALEMRADAQCMHGALCRAMDSSRKGSSILYRVRGGNVYVSAEHPPVAERLPKGVRIVGTRDISKWVQSFQNGQLAMFDLIAAPSKKQRRDGHRNSQRVKITDRKERMMWLLKEGEKHGFRVLRGTIGEDVHVTGYHRGPSGRFHLHGCRYEGVLEITDAERFRCALKDGIGPEKAYGFGMLFVRPITEKSQSRE